MLLPNHCLCFDEHCSNRWYAWFGICVGPHLWYDSNDLILWLIRKWDEGTPWSLACCLNGVTPEYLPMIWRRSPYVFTVKRALEQQLEKQETKGGDKHLLSTLAYVQLTVYVVSNGKRSAAYQAKLCHTQIGALMLWLQTCLETFVWWTFLSGNHEKSVLVVITLHEFGKGTPWPYKAEMIHQFNWEGCLQRSACMRIQPSEIIELRKSNPTTRLPTEFLTEQWVTGV